MPGDQKPQLHDLTEICRRLADARRQVADLESQRDALISALREQGISGAVLAARTGLTPGRVTQIATNHQHPAPDTT